MRTMIYSPEFWSREAFRAKIKTPYELVIPRRALARMLILDRSMDGRLGTALSNPAPTGYFDKRICVNTGALLTA